MVLLAVGAQVDDARQLALKKHGLNIFPDAVGAASAERAAMPRQPQRAVLVEGARAVAVQALDVSAVFVVVDGHRGRQRQALRSPEELMRGFHADPAGVALLDKQ